LKYFKPGDKTDLQAISELYKRPVEVYNEFLCLTDIYGKENKAEAEAVGREPLRV
jgi:hypothetical protein